MALFNVFRRLMCPSVGPLLHSYSSAAATAARSRSNPDARLFISRIRLCDIRSIQLGNASRSLCLRMRLNSRARICASAISGDISTRCSTKARLKRARLLMPDSPPLIPKLELGTALRICDARTEFLIGACRFVDLADRLAQAGMPGIMESLDRRCHIRKHMPAIGNLNGRRRALPRAVSICAGAIAANELHSGVLLEPGRQRRRFPVRKEINRRAPLKVHQNRAVTLPFVLRPVINSDDFWGGRRWQLHLAHRLNERV